MASASYLVAFRSFTRFTELCGLSSDRWARLLSARGGEIWILGTAETVGPQQSEHAIFMGSAKIGTSAMSYAEPAFFAGGPVGKLYVYAVVQVVQGAHSEGQSSGCSKLGSVWYVMGWDKASCSAGVRL